MMTLAKLKAVAVTAAVALALATGLGAGLVPAAANDPPPSGAAAPTAKAPAPRGAQVKEKIKLEPEADDAKFLRRLTLDVRGTLPTDVETWYFVSDADAEKRAKVLDWLVGDGDDEKRAAVAKKLGVPADRVRVVRVKLSADGRYAELATDPKAAKVVVPLVAEGGDRLVADSFLQAINPPTGAQPAPARPLDANRVWDFAPNGDGKAEGVFRSLVVGDNLTWSAADGNRYLLAVGDPKVASAQPAEQRYSVEVELVARPADPDAEFLRRVLTDARGSGPTALEAKYFTEDKDPKKREKLLDAVLKEPAVQKKLGDEWRKKMLAPPANELSNQGKLFYYLRPDGGTLKLPQVVEGVTPPMVVKPLAAPLVKPLPPGGPKQPAAPPLPDKLEKLVRELLAAQKGDEAVLEALTLATLGRLPTDAEKRLALAAAATAADRKAAWVAVARALAPTEPKPGQPLGQPLKLKVQVAPEVPPAKP